MGHIGTIIEKCRQTIGMSRKELAEDICSEKYIYLIEKGERTPSVSLLNLIGERMGVYLFGFYAYIDCEDPVGVKEKMKLFHMCRINLDFEVLNNATEQAENIPDFRSKPWCFEILVNKIYNVVFEEKRYAEALLQLETLIKEVESYEVSDIFLVNAYTLTTTCALVTMDVDIARDAAIRAYEIIQGNHDIELYDQLLTKVTVNLMGAHYSSNEMDDVIERGKELIRIKQSRDSYGKIHFIYMFMALAHYVKNQWDEAVICLKKAVYFLMADNKPEDVSFIALDGRFRAMLDDLSPYSEIIDYFRKEYRV